MNLQEDIDEFYDEEAGDFLASYGFDGLSDERGGDYQSAPDDWPPPLEFWDCDDTASLHPKITFDAGKKTAWEQAKKEVEFLRNKLGHKSAGVDKAFDFLFGESSELFGKFKSKFGIGFYQYSLFMATFLYECKYSVVYSKLVNDPDNITEHYMDLKMYLDLWKKLDNYNKDQKFKKRAWEELEVSLNDTLKELFVPCSTPPEFKMHVTEDDDKAWYNHTISRKDVPIEEESKLKRERHVKDNTPGVVADVCVFTASGFPIHAHFRRPGKTEFDSTKAAVKDLFNTGEGKEQPNISDKITFAADRGYWRATYLTISRWMRNPSNITIYFGDQ